MEEDISLLSGGLLRRWDRAVMARRLGREVNGESVIREAEIVGMEKRLRDAINN